MRKFAVAAAAGAIAAGMALAAPAHAASGPDLAVTSERTGGVTGVYGDGKGAIANVGDAPVPAGTTLTIDVDDMPGLPDELHANSVNFDPRFASARSIALLSQKWRVTTKKELKPGEVQHFSYTVLHYAPWHRVKHQIKLEKLGGGVSDRDTTNDVAAGLNL